MKRVLINEHDLFLAREGEKYVGHIFGVPYEAWGSPKKIKQELISLQREGLVEVLGTDVVSGEDYVILLTR